jgi:hypothetical protein
VNLSHFQKSYRHARTLTRRLRICLVECLGEVTSNPGESMRTISDDEKKTATLVAVDSILSDVDDTEAAFNGFRESFNTGEEPGTVRAWELMIDERGNIGTTKTQTKLGAWPVDAYTLDELCKMLIDQYMTPDQYRMAVRLVGTDPRKSGYSFNKIIMLKRAIKKESSSNGSESTASIMKMMQEMNERNMAMIARLQAPEAKPDTMAEINKMMAFAQSMNAPMMTMLQSLLPALVGRPAPAASDPFTGIAGIFDVAERLSDLRGGGGESGGDNNSVASIIRAIAPLAKPALEALPAIASMQAANRPPALAPAPARAGPPGSGTTAGTQRPPPPGSVPTQPTPPKAAPAPPGPTIHPTDIPSGDSAVLAQLKPQIDSLVAMATQGSDATGAADLIFDQVLSDPRLDEKDFEKIAEFIESDNFTKYVIVMNPAAAPLKDWFDAFKAQIVKRLDEAETDSSTPTPVAPA